ncbi:MAG TPA: immunoglobulin domain-containing protein [Lacunisphaera sp.]|nr:immunoglobulin domain-containing protein [Lacunisphaera sp.]
MRILPPTFAPLLLLVAAIGLQAAPQITQEPADQTAIEAVPPQSGTSAFFTVVANGTAPLSYQWQIQQGGSGTWTDIADGVDAVDQTTYSGSQANRLDLDTLTYPDDDGDKFRCVVTDSDGAATSSAAQLTVVRPQSPPTILSPASTAFNAPYTATADAGFGAVEWALGTGSTAVGAAIDAATGSISFTGVGTVVIKARFAGDAHHLASAYGADFSVTVNPAATTFGLNATNFTYNGAVQGPVIAATPSGASFTSGGTLSATNAGDYTATATATGNYTGTNNSLTWSIAKATVSLTLSGLGVTYDPAFQGVVASRSVVTTFAGTVGSPGSLDGTGSGAMFASPGDAVLDSAGNLFVVDTLNYTVRKVTPAGAVTTFAGAARQAGSTDGPGDLARFASPRAIAIDAADNLYVADTGNHTIRKITPAGLVTTLAGSAGQSGSTDGAGTAARFTSPQGIGVKSDGSVYVCDTGNRTIRKIATTGLVSTYAGSPGVSGSVGGAVSAARFRTPAGMAIDPAGNIYIADTTDRTIRRITPSNIVITMAGSGLAAGTQDGTGTAARFTAPTDITLDGAGNFHVTDGSGIRKITTGATDYLVTTIAGNPVLPGDPAEGSGMSVLFRNPSGLTMDGAGVVYVVDSGNNQIRKISAAGMVTSLAGMPPSTGTTDGTGTAARFAGPWGAAVDAAGNLYVTDTQSHTIRKIAPGGVVTTLAGMPGVPGSLDGPGSTARFLVPRGIAVNNAGEIFVADSGNNRIRKIATDGTVTTFAGGLNGSTDGTGTAARFTLPMGLTLDGTGNLYVADNGNSTIRKITPAGVVTTIAGSPGQSGTADGVGTAARFYAPFGITADGAGNLYVADTFNNTIRKVAPDGTVSTFAGTSNDSVRWRDGVGSAARFYRPMGIAADVGGNLYVTENSNHTVRKIAPDGTVMTLAGTPGVAAEKDGTGGAAQFFSPAGLVFDGTGNLVVADWEGNTVRKITGTSGLVAVTYDGSTSQPTAAGSYGVTATLTDPNFEGTTSGNLIVTKATAAITLGSLFATYDALPHAVTATTNPAGRTVTFTYDGSANPPSNPGSYAVVATIDDPNYFGTASGTLVIADIGPGVTTQSATRNVLEPGDNLTLGVTAAGTSAISYQWYHDHRVVVGATSNSLSLTAVTSTASGAYWVVMTNNAGTTRSPAMFVLVAPAATQVRGWGSSADGRISIPAGLTNAIAVAAGDNHSLALKRDGTVVAWGDNYYGQRTVPGGLTDVVAISAAGTHSMALKSDGTVVTWGQYYWNGQVAVPSELSGVVSINDGGNRSLALKTDGTLVTWGFVGGGTSLTPQLPAGLADVVDMANGGLFAVALKSDGAAVAWDSQTGAYTPSVLPSGLSNVAKLSVNGVHSMALKNDGTVTNWGQIYSGIATTPTGITDVVSISAGPDHSLVVKSNGTVQGWGGYNSYQQATVPSDLAQVFAVAAGSNFSLALRDTSNDTVPTITVPPQSILRAVGASHTFTVTATGVDPFTYQWRKDGVDIPGATSVSLPLSSLQPGDAGNYDVVVSNHVGPATSAAAVLTIEPPPQVTNAPSNRIVSLPGQALDLTVTATSANGPLTYQWLKNSRPIAGAASASYSLPSPTYADAGAYTLVITDAHGLVTRVTSFVLITPAITQVLAWGSNDRGQASLPSGLGRISAIVAGHEHALALRADGTVVAWGYNSGGRTTVPAGLDNVVAIAAGDTHSAALKADGTVVLWGTGYSVPAGLSDVIAISAGNGYWDVLKSDGTVVAWGDSSTSRLTVPPGLTNVTALDAGGFHSLAIKHDGSVVAWGYNGSNRATVPAGLTEAIAVGAGGFHSLAIKPDGTVVAWGDNASGQATVPSGLTGAVAVAGGYGHSLALKSDGTITGWGNNFSGQATAPTGFDHGIAISAGGFFTLALRDASTDPVPAITDQPDGAVLAETQAYTLSVAASGAGPLTYQWQKNGVNITGATSPSLNFAQMALADAGDYTVVVTNHVGSTTSSVATLTVNPVPVITNLSSVRQLLAPGTSLNLAVTAIPGLGTLHYQWFRNGKPIGTDSNSYSQPAVTLADHGYYQVLITDDYGTRRSPIMFVAVAPATTQVRAWGNNNSGPGQVSVPAGLGRVIKVSAGYSHSVALKSDGTVAVWGASNDNISNVPSGLNGVVDVSANGSSTLALKSDGTIVAWGYAGDGTTTIPAGLSNVVAIAGGRQHSLALKSDGTVVAWGYNADGRTAVPAGLTGVVAIAAGEAHSLALKADGTVVAWGYNAQQQATVPASLSGVVAIAAGYANSMAIKSDGTAVVWGETFYSLNNIPSGLGTATDIAGGFYYVVAVKSNGTVVGWGSSGYGETNIPADLAQVFRVAAGYNHVLALRDATTDPVPTINTQPLGGWKAVGDKHTFTVNASGPLPLSYQWRKNGINISGATSSTLTLANLQLTSAGVYDVVVSNHVGGSTSSGAELVMSAAPTVTPGRRVVGTWGQPLNLSADIDSTATPLTYQWKKDNRVIPGATASTYSIPVFANANAGAYTLDVTDSNGQVYRITTFVLPDYGATQLRLWGYFTPYISGLPSGPTSFVGVAAGEVHVVAVKSDGSVVAAGLNNNGSMNVPSGLSGVVAVSTSVYTNIVLKADGTVTGWGDSSHGQTSPPAGLADVIAISTAGGHVLALKSDGTVVAWGSNYAGQTDVPAGLADVVAICAGGSHSLALKANGTVVAWGQNTYGQALVPAGLTGVIGLGAGNDHSLAVKSDGTLISWGSTAAGRLTVPTGLTQVVGVAGGQDGTVARKADGTVSAWGANTSFASPPSDLANVVAVSANYYSAVALSAATFDSVPAIVTHPASQTKAPNQVVTFTVTATSAPAPTYQWQMGTGSTWQNIAEGDPYTGTTTPTLTIAGWAVSALNGIQFRCAVTNNLGAVTSNAAVLTVRAARGDFNGDGKSDILWRHAIGGNVVFWLMNGHVPQTVAEVTPVSTDWVICGTGDFNGDGQTDVIWRHKLGGNVVFWLMNGHVPQTVAEVTPVSTDWVISGTGDFNGDGQTDIVWRHNTGGNIVFWFMNGTTPASAVEITPVSTDWVITTTGDFNNDGKTDIVWRHNTGGTIVFWMMNGSSVQSSAEVTPVSNVWTISTTGDFNGDGQTDIVWRHNTGGNVVFWLMNGTTVQGVAEVTPVSTDWMIVP